MSSVKLKPGTSWSQVKHFTVDPLRFPSIYEKQCVLYILTTVYLYYLYSKTCLVLVFCIRPCGTIFSNVDFSRCRLSCLKQPFKKKTQDGLLLNEGQKYCRMLQGEYSAILSTFIKLPFVISIFALSIFEWLLKTCFAVSVHTDRQKRTFFFASGHISRHMLRQRSRCLTLCMLGI